MTGINFKEKFSELKEYIRQNKKAATIWITAAVLFPIATLIIWFCHYVFRKAKNSKMWVKILAWSLCSLKAASMVVVKVVAVIMLGGIIYSEFTHERREDENIAKWEAMPVEERNALLPPDILRFETGIDFPEYEVLIVHEPTPFTQDPCYTWKLELKEAFDQDYLERLCDNGVLYYDDADGTYVYRNGEYPDFDYEIIIPKWTTVTIYDRYYFY